METLTGLFKKRAARSIGSRTANTEDPQRIGEADYEPHPNPIYNELWNRWHPQLQPTIHRQLGVEIPGSHPAHNQRLPIEERAHALLEHVSQGRGVGYHWTDDPDYKHLAGNGSLEPGETAVTLHAQTPPRDHIEDDDYTLEDRAVRDWGSDREREVPLKRNAPLNITGITWKSVDGTKHHDFSEPIQKRAAREPYTEDLDDDGPIELPYHRRTEKAPNLGATYGQDIEPHGQYFTPHALPESQQGPGYEWGTKSFQRPLRLYSPTGDPSHPDHWKQQLVRRYNGKKGKALSQAIRNDGYDAILTHDDYGPDESVDLSSFTPRGRKATLTQVFAERGIDNEGHQVELDPQDRWQHLDGSVSHNDGTTISDHPVQYAHDHDWLPTGRYWGPNSPHPDQRLFQDDRLRPEIRQDILDRVGTWFDKHGYTGWRAWAKVYFAGSEAAKWVDQDGHGNGDFDILIGIDWPVFRSEHPECADKNDVQVSTEMTDGLWKQANVNGYYFTLADGRKVGPFDRTFYVSPLAWDIRKIHPYAAYDVTDDRWAVHPLLVSKDWSAEKLPESYWDYAEAIASTVKAIGGLPPEERARMARNLWEEIHGHRTDAFSDGGHGLFDLSNVLEKYLDQHPDKLWDQLSKWKRGAPASITQEASVRRDVKDLDGSDYDGVMIALVPPKEVCKDLAVDGGESPDTMHVTLAYLGDKGDMSSERLSELPRLVESWATTQKPLAAHVGGVGTFVNPGSHVLWAAVDLPHGTKFRDGLVHLLEEHGYEVAHDHGWVPHVTISYGRSHFRFMPKIEPASWDVTEVWCCVGGKWESFPVGSGS